MKNKKWNILLPNGKIIKRVLSGKQCGNFNQLYATVNGAKFAVGDGDEYLRGFENTLLKLSHAVLNAYDKAHYKCWILPPQKGAASLAGALVYANYEDFGRTEYNYTFKPSFWDGTQR